MPLVGLQVISWPLLLLMYVYLMVQLGYFFSSRIQLFALLSANTRLIGHSIAISVHVYCYIALDFERAAFPQPVSLSSLDILRFKCMLLIVKMPLFRSAKGGWALALSFQFQSIYRTTQ